MKAGLDRSHTRGLAIFSCAAHDLWEVFALPVPVQSRVVINNAPAVSQLESVLEESEALAVLLADKQRARLFVFELGDLVEHSELFDELPREYDTPRRARPGRRRRTTSTRWCTNISAMPPTRRGVRRRKSATRTSRSGRPDEIAKELESLLHPYLRERLCGRVHVQVERVRRRHPRRRGRDGTPGRAAEGGRHRAAAARGGRHGAAGRRRAWRRSSKRWPSIGSSGCWCRRATTRRDGGAARAARCSSSGASVGAATSRWRRSTTSSRRPSRTR